MNDNRPRREIMSIEEATVSNMWEIAAIVELLEQRGLCSKQDLHTIIDELRQRYPRARIAETTFPEPYLLTEMENKIIDQILDLFNTSGLNSQQSLHLLERFGKVIEMIAGNQNSTALSHTDTFLHYEVDSIHIEAGATFPRY
jgi:hypothetical protein